MGHRMGGADVRGVPARCPRRHSPPHVAETPRSRGWQAQQRLGLFAPRFLGDHRFAQHRLARDTRGQLLVRGRPSTITLQEARHTAATWLDAAGVRPKVASVLMGHSVPERQPGAAAITLARYTHALPEDIERARHQLNAYLNARDQDQKASK